MKTWNHLAIYNPNGAAGEYARWACNIYNGCPHQCKYCYCRTGFMGTVIGGPIPTIKKTLGGNENDAFNQFCKELGLYAEQIRAEGGLWFSFSTDPMVLEELPMTLRCIEECFRRDIPVVVLTKAVQWWYDSYEARNLFCRNKHQLAVGFTLTGCDEMDGNAPSNSSRIDLMAILKEKGFKIWASIEPIIDPLMSLSMIRAAEPYCDHFKVGLRSGVKRKEYYKEEELRTLYSSMDWNNYRPTYLKDSFLKFLDIDRNSLNKDIFVGRDYKLV